MSLFSWFNSAEVLGSVVFYVGLTGAVLEVLIAVAAFVDLRNETLAKEKERKLELFVAVAASVAAVFGISCVLLSQRASNLQEAEHRKEMETQSNLLAQATFELKELESAVAWRTISPKQKAIIIERLTSIGKRNDNADKTVLIEFHDESDFEARQYAKRIEDVLKECGINAIRPDFKVLVGEWPDDFEKPTGLGITQYGYVPSSLAESVLGAFRLADVQFDALLATNHPPDGILRIMVWPKREK
jgi:hypothetical protein